MAIAPTQQFATLKQKAGDMATNIFSKGPGRPDTQSGNSHCGGGNHVLTHGGVIPEELRNLLRPAFRRAK